MLGTGAKSFDKMIHRESCNAVRKRDLHFPWFQRNSRIQSFFRKVKAKVCD